jgi:hypothetical protein
VSPEPDTKPLCLAAWKGICAPKSEGGLGFEIYRLSTMALSFRWSGELQKSPMVCYCILKSKYFSDTSIWRPNPNLFLIST